MENSGSIPPEKRDVVESMEKLEKTIRASLLPVHRQMFRHFLTGLASSLGAMVALVIVVPLLVFILNNIEWVPLIGSFVAEINYYLDSIPKQ